MDRNSLDGWDDAASGVALRKESVDRNFDGVVDAVGIGVALRKESVDRNTRLICTVSGDSPCRSPQGERG